MGTIVEETTTTEIIPEKKITETDNVEEEKVDDQPNNEPETEPSSSRVQMSARLYLKFLLKE